MSEAVIIAVTTAVCTALPLLLGQWLRHKEAMRKLDAIEHERREAREALRAQMLSIGAHVEQVEKNTNGLVAERVRIAEDRVHDAYARSGFPSLKTGPGTLE